MKVIVDANILFSAIITSQGKIADILTNPGSIELISPLFLKNEISKHKPKIAKFTKLTLSEIDELEFLLSKNINFFSENIIHPPIWKKAENFAEKVDINDSPYVAFSIHFKSKIWTGDKKLINGLSKNGFNKFITTDKLLRIRNK